MPWTSIIFDRETLYAEVWKEPVSAVAKRYRLSDVALRKICMKLGVPVPPLGYWAKAAAGRTPPIAKLPASHKGPTRHVRQVREDPEAPERERRIAALLEADPIPSLPPPTLKAAIAETHLAVRRTARALRKREYSGRGLLHAEAEDVFAMSVSAVNKDRALLILDAIIATALAAGGEVEPSTKTKRPLLKVRGEPFELTIHEPTRRAEGHTYVFVPTGKIRLEIRAEGAYSPLLTLTDGRVQIETRLEVVVPALMQKAAEVIETLLNHVSGTRSGIVGAYQRHDYFPEMKKAIALWERKLAKLASP